MLARTADRRTCRAAKTATVVVAASVALVAGCTSSPAAPVRPGPPPTSGPARVPRSATPLPLLAQPDTTAAAGTNSPADAAEHWLAAYRSMSWTDGTPTAWIARVRPYVTARLDRQDEQYADAGGGADWQTFVAGQCTSTVTDLGAVIPSESPGTAIAVNVEVTATVYTACDAGQSTSPTETASATLVVIPLSDGSWRVDQRLY